MRFFSIFFFPLFSSVYTCNIWTVTTLMVPIWRSVLASGSSHGTNRTCPPDSLTRKHWLASQIINHVNYSVNTFLGCWGFFWGGVVVYLQPPFSLSWTDRLSRTFDSLIVRSLAMIVLFIILVFNQLLEFIAFMFNNSSLYACVRVLLWTISVDT